MKKYTLLQSISAGALTLALAVTTWADSTVTVGVEGMTCGSCVNAVTEAFKKAGYDDVVVSLKEKKATLNLKSEKQLNETEISKVIESVGFKPGKIEKK